MACDVKQPKWIYFSIDICNANEQEHCCDAGDKNSSWNPSVCIDAFIISVVNMHNAI